MTNCIRTSEFTREETERVTNFVDVDNIYVLTSKEKRE